MFLPRRGLGARSAWFCALGLMLAGAGCEPASITDAHTQLARGPVRIDTLVVPIIQDSEAVPKYITDTVTLADGLEGVRFDSTVGVGVGSKLRFNGVTSTRFKYDVPGAVFLAGNPVATDTSYALLSVEPRLTAIDTIVVDSGSITITTANRLSVPVNVKVTLNGFRNSVGATLVDPLFVTGMLAIGAGGLAVARAPGDDAAPAQLATGHSVPATKEQLLRFFEHLEEEVVAAVGVLLDEIAQGGHGSPPFVASGFDAAYQPAMFAKIPWE